MASFSPICERGKCFGKNQDHPIYTGGRTHRLHAAAAGIAGHGPAQHSGPNLRRPAGSGYAREQVFNIIDGRYLTRKPLIVTTNLSLKAMKNPKDLAEQRIFDRVLEMCIPVCFDGESLRQEKAKQRMQLYRQLTEAESSLAGTGFR